MGKCVSPELCDCEADDVHVPIQPQAMICVCGVCVCTCMHSPGSSPLPRCPLYERIGSERAADVEALTFMVAKA